MIRLSQVAVRAGEKVVLHPLSVQLGEPSVALVGPNGSGKSTLLRLLNGLVLPSAGTVEVDGLQPEHALAAVRRRVGFVFPDPDAQVVMPTPVQDVALSLRRAGVPRRDREEHARRLLAEQGLAEGADGEVRRLSSGQRQLLALTAVLATGPAVLACDEPTTLLDLRNARRVADVLLSSPAQLVVATHDLDLAARTRRALWLHEGRVVADGPAAQVVAAYRAGA
ncbi:energy-coupling factor ABC transporter ATP-binding protein [Kineococcus arenarius]|uniref:energy-coupling factor ABC transporter ATP-binding protein n=1 Tax=Kineococcus sp. SYSU DK007 TaxID=3383128 RepID=UPI003D7E9C05